MRDLLEIAKTHDAGVRTMLAAGIEPLVLDTDPLMTAVWADILFGTRDPWFDEWQGTADLYLLFDIDLPWVADGTRLFGSPEARQRFFDLSKAELERRGVRWALVSGAGEARWDSVLRAIDCD
jgi:nicotinamide riboside kinase